MALNKSYLIIALLLCEMGNMHSLLGLLSVYLSRGPGCHAFSVEVFHPASLLPFLYLVLHQFINATLHVEGQAGVRGGGSEIQGWECDFKRPIPAQKPSKGSFCSLCSSLLSAAGTTILAILQSGAGLTPCGSLCFSIIIFWNIYVFIWLHPVLVAALGLRSCGALA